MKIIDFRARPNTQRYMDFFESGGAKYTIQKQGFPVPPVVSLEEFIKGVDEAGISKIVFTGRDVETTRRWFYPNDLIAEAMNKYPDRIIGFVGVDPLKGRKATEEIDRCVGKMGFKGVSLDPSGVGEPVDNRRFYPIYEKCLEYDIPVVFTLGPLPSPAAGRMKVNNPMAIDEVACDLTELKIVCAHMGWPWITEMIAIAWRHPNVYIETSNYHYMPGCHTYVEAANTIIPDKIIFASGFPFHHPLKDAVEKFLKLPYKKDVMEKVLYHNAARLLRIEA